MKVQLTERAVDEYRTQIDTRKPESYGFASMAAVPYAHIVANLLRNKRIKGASITLAPNPKDIVCPTSLMQNMCPIFIFIKPADLAQFERESRRAQEQEDDRLDLSVDRLLLQHSAAFPYLHPCQLGCCESWHI